MTAVFDSTANTARIDVAKADRNAGARGGKITFTSGISKKMVLLWAFGGLLIIVALALAGWGIHYAFPQVALKGYLDEYRVISRYEIFRPLPHLSLSNVTKEECAKNCSSSDTFECLHLQFCAQEGADVRMCQLFSADATTLRSVPSDMCDVYTKGDPAEFRIPHGGASLLKKGPFQALIWASLTLVTFKFVIA